MSKSKRGFVKEFKEFIAKGNVMNLAVGVIIGAAFQAIVNSLVSDIIMPVISIVTGGLDFSEWFFVLGEGKYDTLAAAKEAGAAVVAYGSFIAAVINFLIMAFVIFMLVKLLNKVTSAVIPKKQEAEKPKPELCRYCRLEVDKEATRCPHCTSELKQ